MEKYYELIIYLLDCHKDGLIKKDILKGIPEKDLQAALDWAYQRMKNSDSHNHGTPDHAEKKQNAFDFEEWVWSYN